jgi:hypothetical protein
MEGCGLKRGCFASDDYDKNNGSVHKTGYHPTCKSHDQHNTPIAWDGYAMKQQCDINHVLGEIYVQKSSPIGGRNIQNYSICRQFIHKQELSSP